MKRTAVILALMFPISALAEAASPMLKVPEWTRMELQKPKLKFQKKKLWNLAALPAYFMLETTIHEGSHGIAGAARGGKLASFQPYPHIIPGKFVEDNHGRYGGKRMVGVNWEPRRFYFGSVYFSANTRFTKTDEALMLAAPYMTDALLFATTDLLLGYAVDPKSISGLILYTVGMVAPLINFTFNSFNAGEYSDFGRLGDIIGSHGFVARAAFYVGARAMILLGIWRLWVRGREVLFAPAPAKPSRFSFAPFASGDAKGVAGIVRF